MVPISKQKFSIFLVISQKVISGGRERGLDGVKFRNGLCFLFLLFKKTRLYLAVLKAVTGT